MSNVTVFHGTGNYALDGFLTEPPHIKSRHHVKRKCFCATKSFRVAGLFAFRHSSFEELKTGRCGVVLEFELDDPSYGRDYEYVRDRGTCQEEDEVAIYNVKKLTLLAIWENHSGEWRRSQRYPMNREALSRKLDVILFENKAEDVGDVGMSGTVAVFRLNEHIIEVLVGVRLWDPDRGKLALPGGHLKKGEDPEKGALRELEEETGLHFDKARMVLDRPPEIGRETRDISFAVVLETDQPLSATSDLASLQWLDVSKMPPLAFKDELIVHQAMPKVLDRSDLSMARVKASSMKSLSPQPQED